MKLKLLFLLISIIVVVADPAKKHVEPNNPLPDNKLVKYVRTIILRLKGDIRDTQLNECVPQAWLWESNEEFTKNAEKLMTGLVKKLDGIYSSLDMNLNLPCEMKDQVKRKFKAKKGLAKEKVFLELSSSKLKRKRTAFAPFDLIFEKYSMPTKEALAEYFKSYFFIETKLILQCYQTAANVPLEFKEEVSKFLSNVQKFGTDSYTDVMIDAICNWQLFKDALLKLGKAKMESNEFERWVIYGKFVASLVNFFG